MATRCNILVKKGLDLEAIYHHWDGYPKVVGVELQQFIENNMELATSAEPSEFAQTLEKHDSTYESNESLHGDINYLYIVDCDKKETRCYDVKRFSLTYVILTKMITCEETEEDEFQKLIYSAPFDLPKEDFLNLIRDL